jgi:hypothetical protein
LGDAFNRQIVRRRAQTTSGNDNICPVKSGAKGVLYPIYVVPNRCSEKGIDPELGKFAANKLGICIQNLSEQELGAN